MFGGVGGFLLSCPRKAISGCETSQPVLDIDPEKSEFVLQTELVTLGLPAHNKNISK